MPFGNMGPWQLLLILAVVLLIFGAARLPALAKSLGQSARVFKGEMKQMKSEKDKDEDAGTVRNEAAQTEQPPAADSGTGSADTKS